MKNIPVPSSSPLGEKDFWDDEYLKRWDCRGAHQKQKDEHALPPEVERPNTLPSTAISVFFPVASQTFFPLITGDWMVPLWIQ